MTQQPNQGSIWNVAIPSPLRRAFAYEIPPHLGTPVSGARVLVPFGHRKLTGYLIEPSAPDATQGFSLRAALEILDDEPLLPQELLRFLTEAAFYYMHPLGEVLKAALPSGIDYKESQGTLRGPILKLRTYRLARPTGEASQALSELRKSAPKRAEILSRIIDEQQVTLSDLRKYHKSATATVKRLAQDGLVHIEECERLSDPFLGPPIHQGRPPEPTDEQETAIKSINQALDEKKYKGFLLHGVTGSGKTEVYFRAIAHCRAQNRGALILVPEISLTPQLVHRYRARFGDQLAVLHSGLTPRERFDQWHLLRSGQVQVAMGVRSAVFAPVENLGLIIVDEEHDSSFKQEKGFRYSARDLTLLRAARTGAVAVLGSATPSLETNNNANWGKLSRLTLTKRATAQPLPQVEIIDLTRHRSGPGGQTAVSEPLYRALSQVLANGEQAILFLNRRGFAPALLCTSCGELTRCDFCAVSLTFHLKPPALICHYCGTRKPVPNSCASCGCGALKPVGTGTQKAEEILTQLFPSARIGRLDRDTGAGRKSETLLGKLRDGEIDILVGTQMVTKGHDFPNVTLVGVLNADVGLHMPDFRAAERTFQLLTQVSGRAGRSEKGGRALVQTYNPEHHAIVLAKTHNFEEFAAIETAAREELQYPPFGYLAALRLSGLELNKTEDAARRLFAQAKTVRDKMKMSSVTLLGPVPAPLSQLQGRHRFRILLRSPRRDLLRQVLEPLLPAIESPPSGVRTTLDIDPVSML